jgi:hypothetical protein
MTSSSGAGKNAMDHIDDDVDVDVDDHVDVLTMTMKLLFRPTTTEKDSASTTMTIQQNPGAWIE